MRIVDTMLAFPGLLLAIGILAALGAGMQNVALAIGLCAFPRFARIGRAQMLSESTLDYVTAARVTGAFEMPTMLCEVANNALPPLLLQAALSMADATNEAMDPHRRRR
jgi:dipeptide transport system permease protein